MMLLPLRRYSLRCLRDYAADAMALFALLRHAASIWRYTVHTLPPRRLRYAVSLRCRRLYAD